MSIYVDLLFIVNIMLLKGFSMNTLDFMFHLAFFKPPPPQTGGARASGQGSQPPRLEAHGRNPHHSYTSPQQDRSHPPALRNSQLNTSAHRQMDQTHTNGMLPSSAVNANPSPHNGVDNPAFTQADDHNVNTHLQQQNPNILIQAGPAQGGAQLPAVQVSLNAPSQAAQQNDSAPMPTIHVNLNSFSASQAQQDLTHTGSSNPRMQSGLSSNSDGRFHGQVGAGQPGMIPTGYTHSGTTLQRNANTQTYLQEPDPHRTSERISSRRNPPASSSPQQMPWDRLRGTPAYPSGTVPQGPMSNENSSHATDYASHPPIREEQHRQTAPRSRAEARHAALSTERQTRSRSADLIPNTRRAAETEATDHTHRSPPSQQSIRGLITSLIASRHESTHSNSPQTGPRSSQQVSAGPSAVSQGHMSQQGLHAPQADDTRALADPNHLPQMHMAPQRRAAPSQKPAQGHGTHTQPVANGAKQPRQGGTAPGPTSAPQAHPGNLTQAALRAHALRTPTFPNRRQQTQAALLHAAPQARAPAPAAAAAQHPPLPPPVIPLAEFQSLPRKHAHHRSPAGGPRPPRPPVNVPVAQRPQQTHQHHNARPRHATVPAQVPHGAHRHAHAHAHGHRPAAHTTHPRQVSQPWHFFMIVLELKSVNVMNSHCSDVTLAVVCTPAWVFLPLLGDPRSWLTASWVAETRQTSVVLPLWQFAGATFRLKFCLFPYDTLENEGLIVSLQQQAHGGRMRWWQVSADSTGPRPPSTDKPTADRRDPLYQQARLCPATAAIFAVSLPNVLCSGLWAFVV